MPYSQGFPITAAGRVSVVDEANVVLPVSKRGALSFDANQSLVVVGVTGQAPAADAGGFPFNSFGSVKIVLLGTIPNITLPPHSTRAGISRAADIDSGIYCAASFAIDHYENGLPFDADGALCIEYGGVAPLGGPFSNGFSSGFA